MPCRYIWWRASPSLTRYGSVDHSCILPLFYHILHKPLTTFVVSLPELVAQTNMDQQSVNRLREEITKFTNWLGKNYTKYFVSEYETPGPDYIEKSRSA